ncbi:metallopeptidase family protein [Candidatus Peregrinibacteria bacterium]|nr:metallopeptidase family protein [Candidatus Peregrinibacteria bacterium]
MYNDIVDTLRFEKLVAAALSSLPKKLRDAVSNVAIVIENSPRKKHTNEIAIGNRGVLLGLYEGVPQTQWGKTQSGVLPDKITIFKQSIESLATDDYSLKELVRDVVWHEIGHHFGFTDKELRRIEKRRQQSG